MLCLVLQIKALPVQLYEYKYDSVMGRRQLGVLGRDVQVTIYL
jgi:hypothetical protein